MRKQEKKIGIKEKFQKIKEKIKNREKWDKKKKIRVALIIVAIVIILIGAVFATYVYKADGSIATAALNMTADVLGDEDPIFVLILGISEDIQSELTDTIILCGYNPDSQKAFMLSIPRDTFIGKSEASANGYDKINALYQKGPEKTVEAVEKLTGINIDNYVIVKNTALPAIVDAIGEVEFDVPIDMDYDDVTQDLHIHLKAGVQKIDGDKAEQLLRFRHNTDGSSYPSSYGDNDYGRMRTQREFIKAVATQLISWDNVGKLKNVASAVFDNLETDMKLTKALGYVPHGLQFNVENLRMEQLPGSSAMINALWFYQCNKTETYDLINELLEELALNDKEFKKHYTLTRKDTTTTNVKKDKASNTNTSNTNTSYKNNLSDTYNTSSVTRTDNAVINSSANTLNNNTSSVVDNNNGKTNTQNQNDNNTSTNTQNHQSNTSNQNSNNTTNNAQNHSDATPNTNTSTEPKPDTKPDTPNKPNTNPQPETNTVPTVPTEPSNPDTGGDTEPPSTDPTPTESVAPPETEQPSGGEMLLEN